MIGNTASTVSSDADKFIIRRYDGIKSLEDMVSLNQETSKQADRFIELKKPLRILLDTRGIYATTPAIYKEAISFLNLYEIEKIAILHPVDQKIEILTQNAKDTYQKYIEYRKFDSESAAKVWLEEA